MVLILVHVTLPVYSTSEQAFHERVGARGGYHLSGGQSNLMTVAVVVGSCQEC